MINYSLLRTAGHLAANFATHQHKMSRLKSERETATAKSVDIDPRVMAEKLYGPTDSLWEGKYRRGGLLLLSETEALMKLNSWSTSNTCRFLEMAYFTIDQVDDPEGMNHVKRLDFANLELIGSNAWTRATEIIEECSRTRNHEIQQAAPLFKVWYENVTSGPFLNLIEVAQLSPEGRKCPGNRSFCELHI